MSCRGSTLSLHKSCGLKKKGYGLLRRVSCSRRSGQHVESRKERSSGQTLFVLLELGSSLLMTAPYFQFVAHPSFPALSLWFCVGGWK